MSFPGQDLDDVYANVYDSAFAGGAVARAGVDDTTAIQQAIDTGRHVLFPAGDFRLLASSTGHETLNFDNDGQRCTFLAGAILRIESPDATVIITGKDQAITGLNVTTASASITPDQCVLIDGADGLVLKDARVTCSSPSTAVRIRNTEGISIQSGRITGNSNDLSVGIELDDGARSLNAVGVALDQLGQGVVVVGAAQNISFTNSTIEANATNMVEVRTGGSIRGLSLLGVHMEYGSGDFGCDDFIVVQAGATVEGGILAGCEFGGLGPDAAAQRVFVIIGNWLGVTVVGCWHHGASDETAAEHSVWEIRPTANIAGSCDMFNSWDNVSVQVDGTRQDDGSMTEVATMPTLQNTEGGTLTVKASAVRIRSTRLGFFGSTPVERPAAYTIDASLLDPTLGGGAHDLTSANAAFVLATLLQDLAALGLIALTAS